MKKKKDSSFAKKTKIALAEKGETQASIARKMGVTRAQINLWLRGNRIPKMDSLQKLADALGKPVNYFFENSGNNIVNNKDTNVFAHDGLGTGNVANKMPDNFRLALIEKDLEILKQKVALLELKIKK